ncbi:MAG TPA: RagB/SusD family nutrient uptake outer membrane protein [Bacteroidales bacterium]|nr:RagB/SusD family nutrient uptake outer membrane protein [Bacteroidales bacterium]
MKKIYLLPIAMIILCIGCDLEQIPQATVSKEAIFGSEKGLELYSNSFYNILPSANTVHRADCISDYGARRDAPAYLVAGAYTPTTTDVTSESGYASVALGGDANWVWTSLRNVNYFIVNCSNPILTEKIPIDVRKHYIGLAKFFRAWFYFEKVKRYGDVPWINKPMDVTDPDIYKPRDPRTLVMDSILADLNYACQNIKTTSDATRSLITKWVAYAFKSRVCLFEGTFRKYHPELGLASTANTWLIEAANAAKTVMDESGFKIYTGAGTDLSYRKVFTNSTPVAEEVMLANIMDLSLGVLHNANWVYTSSTTGIRFNFIKTFINTYLRTDGTPFTEIPGYDTIIFRNEVKGRDKRLQQTIRMGDYKRLSAGVLVPTPPNFGYSYTGYQPIKWCLDDVYYDTRDLNINPISIFRFAEILLNYAEAKAELGTLTDTDWANTIGKLRSRAGITGGLNAKPTIADTYLIEKYFPDITDPVILEIRRERGIELCMEGFRFYDLMRWKRGELLAMEWNGMYVPFLATPMDLNEDGVLDVCFYQGSKPSPAVPGVTYIDVSATIGGKPNPMRLKNNTYGEVVWLNTMPRTWEDKKYFYPIPEADRLMNPNLVQNPGW